MPCGFEVRLVPRVVGKERFMMLDSVDEKCEEALHFVANLFMMEAEAGITARLGRIIWAELHCNSVRVDISRLGVLFLEPIGRRFKVDFSDNAKAELVGKTEHFLNLIKIQFPTLSLEPVPLKTEFYNVKIQLIFDSLEVVSVLIRRGIWWTVILRAIEKIIFKKHIVLLLI